MLIGYSYRCLLLTMMSHEVWWGLCTKKKHNKSHEQKRKPPPTSAIRKTSVPWATPERYATNPGGLKRAGFLGTTSMSLNPGEICHQRPTTLHLMKLTKSGAEYYQPKSIIVLCQDPVMHNLTNTTDLQNASWIWGFIVNFWPRCWESRKYRRLGSMHWHSPLSN